MRIRNSLRLACSPFSGLSRTQKRTIWRFKSIKAHEATLHGWEVKKANPHPLLSTRHVQQPQHSQASISFLLHCIIVSVSLCFPSSFHRVSFIHALCLIICSSHPCICSPSLSCVVQPPSSRFATRCTPVRQFALLYPHAQSTPLHAAVHESLGEGSSFFGLTQSCTTPTSSRVP